MKRWLKPNNSAADEANKNPSTSKSKRRIQRILGLRVHKYQFKR